jgi:hypothetical protein
MLDKLWLEKVFNAYNVYSEKNKNIEDFIYWLYKQYGIIPPKGISDKE